MKFKFDKNNTNCILIYDNLKIINMIAIPPTKSKCDIIILHKPSLYMNNFDGLIIFSNNIERNMYHNGILIDTIKRKI